MQPLLTLLHQSPVAQALLLAAPVLIVLDVLTAVLVALKQHTFAPHRLADFAGNDLVKYVSILLATAAAALAGANLVVALAAQQALLAALLVSTAASTAEHLQTLTGLPIAFWLPLIEREIPQASHAPVAPPE